MEEITISLTKEDAELLCGFLKDLSPFINSVTRAAGRYANMELRNVIDTLRYKIEDKIS